MSKFGFFILVFLLIIGCGSPEKGNFGQQRQLSFSMDTVLVDPGDEILYLRANLFNAELSEDGRFLYNYNPTDHALEKIDLDELRLVGKKPFEREGPQGTGFFTPFFLLGEDSLLVAGSLKQVGIFNMDGQLLEEIELQQTLDGRGNLEGKDFFRLRSIVPGKDKQFLGFKSDWKGRSKQLMKVDVPKNQITEQDLPAFEKLMDYHVEYKNGNDVGFLVSQVFLQAQSDKIVISNNVFNELYILLPESDSLILKTYESRLTPNQKSPYIPKQVENREVMDRILIAGMAEIEFEKLVWDKKNERHYRFSYQADMEKVVENGYHSMSVKSKDIFMTVFDKDLEMLAESRVPLLSNIPKTYFVKDGAIWIFENMEDELGFVRLKIDL